MIIFQSSFQHFLQDSISQLRSTFTFLVIQFRKFLQNLKIRTPYPLILPQILSSSQYLYLHLLFAYSYTLMKRKTPRPTFYVYFPLDTFLLLRFIFSMEKDLPIKLNFITFLFSSVQFISVEFSSDPFAYCKIIILKAYNVQEWKVQETNLSNRSAQTVAKRYFIRRKTKGSLLSPPGIIK